MSQQVLADLAGVTQGYVSQIEAGKRPLERRSTQVAVARALNVSVAQLVGSPTDRVDPLLDRAVAHVPRIRQAVVELAAGERRTPRRGPDELAAASGDIAQLYAQTDYAGIAPLLPDLLVDLVGAGPALTPALISVASIGVSTLKSLGYLDLAHMAISLTLPMADEYGSPQWIGQARHTWTKSFSPESAALAAGLARKAADVLQGVPGREAHEMYGHLHLSSAFASAVALKADDARAHLAEAEQVAGVLGEPEVTGPMLAGFNGNWFGPTNVAFWRMAVAAELHDVGEALAVDRAVDTSVVPAPSRLVYYWTDLARVLAGGGRDRAALHALARAERAAPQHFRFNPGVRDLVATMLTRAKHRAVDGELTQLARALGLTPL
jgi:transcriptional regulator with XRE-family HTH domain